MAGEKSEEAKRYADLALLPEGFRDELPPTAGCQSAIAYTLMQTFFMHGYDQVRPPLVEFEESLAQGPLRTKAQSMFRLMDPDTQRVLALRSDMTAQISRLAATRLRSQPRPLRLAYAGTVLRVKGSQIRPLREFMQAGIELVGSRSIEAELEVIMLALAGFKKLGIEGVSLDLTTAPLVSYLIQDLKIDPGLAKGLRRAMDAKDSDFLRHLNRAQQDIFTKLIESAGSADTALEVIQGLGFKGHAGRLVARLARLVDRIKAAVPDLSITIDPCESHGFEYKSGIGFAFFSASARGELARGGRYIIQHADGQSEEAVGFSAYLDRLIAVAKEPEQLPRLFIPAGQDTEGLNEYHQNGWRTIRGLDPAGDPDYEAEQEAVTLGCSHFLLEGEIKAL